MALLLCACCLLWLPVAATAELAPFAQNTDSATALFVVESPRHGAGQEFVADFPCIKGIKVFLQNTKADNGVTITVNSGSPVGQTTEIYSQQDFIATANTGWYTFEFEKIVEIPTGTLCSFVLQAEDKCVVFGTTEAKSTVCSGLNYDVAAYGNVWQRTCTTAFELIPDVNAAVPNAVIALIDAIPDPVTLNDKPQVEAAREAYNALVNTYRPQVTNINKLLQAEMEIARLEKNASNDAVNAIINAIKNIGPITDNSGAELEAINQQYIDLVNQYGMPIRTKVTNISNLWLAIRQYNAGSSTVVIGDVNGDTKIDAKDALLVLQFAVAKTALDADQRVAADVSDDKNIDAVDALQILKYAVGKQTAFTAKPPQRRPIEEVHPMYSKKNESLFKATYQSMLDRTHDNGYAQTSINGVYPGMFGRDSSIQIMAHVAAGDYDQAAKLIGFIVQYHNTYNVDYVLHIMAEEARPISAKEQPDATFFFLHAWYLYVTQAPQTDETRAFIESTLPRVRKFADYYLNDYYMKDNGLLLTPSLEHSRDGRYWKCFDLLTNTYASQALHELSLYFAQSDPENARRWGEWADSIAAGIHEHLTYEIDGLPFYAELIDEENGSKFYPGFSWVNLAPMGCDWYAADPELVENTYQLYMKYGACKYYGKYKMLDVCSTYNGKPLTRGNHVIGKGLAWEMLYCSKMGYEERLQELTDFIEANSVDMYRETWAYGGGGGDTANQEHASWMLYANLICFPKLKAFCGDEPVTGLRVGTYNIHILSDVSQDASVIAKDITDNGLDIVGLQEVDQNTVRTGRKDQIKELADALGWHYGYGKAIDLEGGAYGIALVSKYPIVSFETEQLPSGSEEQRVVCHAVVRVGARLVNVFNTHLTWTGLQSQQFAKIAELLDGLDNYIITGDFNCSDFSAFSVLGGQLVNNGTSTFITNAEDGAIDNIVVSNGYTIGTGQMVNTGHSDHKMLYVDITF